VERKRKKGEHHGEEESRFRRKRTRKEALLFFGTNSSERNLIFARGRTPKAQTRKDGTYREGGHFPDSLNRLRRGEVAKRRSRRGEKKVGRKKEEKTLLSLKNRTAARPKKRGMERNSVSEP